MNPYETDPSELESREEVEDYWRHWASEEGWNKSTLHRDHFAHFMSKVMPEVSFPYARKWLNAFQDGYHMNKMDLENREEYLKILVERGELNESVVLNVAEVIQDE